MGIILATPPSKSPVSTGAGSECPVPTVQNSSKHLKGVSLCFNPNMPHDFQESQVYEQPAAARPRGGAA
eukprot:752659-Hanusia_phi.AAC.4